MSRIASNVDSVVENIEKAIEQNANVCNITKSIDIKSKKVDLPQLDLEVSERSCVARDRLVSLARIYI